MRGPEHDPVEDHVRRAADLVEIDVAAPPVARRIVEHDVDALHHLGRDRRVQQIGVVELDRARVDERAQVLEPAAAQVVDDADLCAPRDGARRPDANR